MSHWKDRLGVLYSTDPNYQYQTDEAPEAETLPPAEQRLRVGLSKSGRAGKEVSLISGFVGTTQDLEDLGKLLKQRCGTGGSVKDGDILIQGDKRDRLVELLLSLGYRQTKRSGG